MAAGTPTCFDSYKQTHSCNARRDNIGRLGVRADSVHTLCVGVNAWMRIYTCKRAGAKACV
eukprot:407357-Pleurochrysis_carterae.AAC.3